MAKSSFITLIEISNTLHLSKTPLFTTLLQIIFYAFLCNIFVYSNAIPFELTDTDNYLSPDDPILQTLWFPTMIVKNNIT